METAPESPAPPAAAGPALPGKIRGILAPYRLPLIFAALHLLLFTLARAALLILYWKDFSLLSGGTIAWGFVRGVRFDAAVIALVAGLPLWFLTFPFPWAQGRLWRGLWGWASFATFAAFALGLCVDTVYFGYVHRHVGHEIMFLGEAVESVADSAGQFVLQILVFLLASAGLFWGWRCLMRLGTAPMKPGIGRIAATVVLLGFLGFVARGSTLGKRLEMAHAFTGAPPAAACLALNGPFAAIRSFGKGGSLQAGFYPWPEALQTVREDLFSPEEKPADPDFPLLRSRPPRGTPGPNVVLIMMESWDAFFTDVYRRDLGLPPLGLTPNFDALSREGLRFTRFYACGQKSMDGMGALLCGFPTLPQSPYLGRGMERSSLTYLGWMGRSEGYGTYFIQSSKRASFGNDAVAAIAGFTTYLGSEDIPPTAPGAAPGGIRWDHEMFAEAHRRLSAAPAPFLAFLYTSSTHPPYGYPDRKWEKYPPKSTENRYRNSLGYVDGCLGQFVAAAREGGYYDRTVFIVTSDHVGCSASARPGEPSSLHHIPCLIFGGGLKPSTVTRIGSQLDILPTIADLAGWGSPHATLGRSLLDASAVRRGALCVEADIVLRVEEGGEVIHNLSRRIHGRGGDVDAIERRLLSTIQVAASLLQGNRVAPRR